MTVASTARLAKAALLSLALLLVPVWGGFAPVQAMAAPQAHCPDHDAAPSPAVPLPPHGAACQIACAALGVALAPAQEGAPLRHAVPAVLLPRPDDRPERLNWPPPLKPPRA